MKKIVIFSILIASIFTVYSQEYCDTLKWKITESYYCKFNNSQNRYEKIDKLDGATINLDTLSYFFPGIQMVNISNDTFYQNTDYVVYAALYIYITDTLFKRYFYQSIIYNFVSDYVYNDTFATAIEVKFDLNDIVHAVEEEGLTINNIDSCSLLTTIAYTDKDGTYSRRVFFAGADTSIFYITKTPVSIQKIKPEQTDICIFPNPAHSQFTVTNTENANIQLYNMQGQQIKRIAGKEENTTIQTDNLPAGMYVLKVEKGNAVVTKKVQVL